jgi:predicted pyridoxine 5'-phosphate oxidase superfamily flavin-nucleotide-binding protein
MGMGRIHVSIDEQLQQFLTAQAVFFVATAPLDGAGHVNVSPKGLRGSFTIIDELTVAYLDLTGSGIETIAHVRDNGRITLMFCAFDGPPRIVRLYGRGEAVLADDQRFTELAATFPDKRGARAVIVIALDRISDSCGYQVPRMAYVEDRTTLDEWADRKDDEAIVRYRAEKNARSIDGLPGLSRSAEGIAR